ncbi:HNH endonuclease [Falsihalocynthiibacter sp. CO-5D18]|uniref:HNH endonuclease n=1 Tax=Falsihalocynthiibacter sp. CO-5D18 TaxID=3240872 RepID=UPI00350F92D5
MNRPNTRPDTLSDLLQKISNTDIEEGIAEYQEADDLDAWMRELNAGRSRRYFLIWHGEKLDAKAIGKAALRAKNIPHQNWHTDPIIDMLESNGFAIWDVERDGDFDSSAARAYETARRLARPGQLQFRRDALALWGNRCAISGTTLVTVLEAAHIVPHAQSGEMRAANSIVLRADLHRLFDAGLIAVDPKTLSVTMQKNVKLAYPDLQEKMLELPEDGPSASKFQERWNEFNAG